MISIIICSQNPAYLQALTQNIEESVGISYELLAIDNKDSKKGIASVYNEAAAKAHYNILCFIHEDIRIHTIDWGHVLVNTLSDENIGLVGISGAVFKSKYPATWSACESNLYRTHSIQHFKNISLPVETNINPLNEKKTLVAVIDGVFMATRKNVFTKFSFDEKLLSGFHGYDIDYSIQVSQKYNMVVSFEILLEHFSEGNFNTQWLNSSIAVHKKWKKKLPSKTLLMSKSTIRFNDYLAINSLLNVALKHNGNKRLVLLNYFRSVIAFWEYNGFKFSKSVFQYLKK